MKIGGLQKLTLIDYPGKIAATVFTIGCNFSCPFCHNPELVDPLKIKEQPVIPENFFFDFLESRKGMLEGVCVTGGEPVLQKDLPEFIRKIKNLGFSVKLDTNGGNPEMLKKLIKEKLVDYFAMDIKGPLEKYQEIIRRKIDLGKIKKSIELIKDSGIDYEFRTTILPEIHTKEDIIQITRDISPAKNYFLQQFRPGKTLEPSFEKEKPYSSEELAEICQAIRPYFNYCGVRE
ncbi:MAG: anaerobic ribonucleoside-triphosphate reductase activating protein [Candidatus Tagabacteria bacterium]